MFEASLIRRVRFSAGHRYWRPEWSEERNRSRFGSSIHPHGHNYEVEVTVRGPVDPETGFAVDLGELDALLREVIVEPLDQRDLSAAIPRFHPGREIPTTENLARWVWDRLRDRIPGGAELEGVRVHESADLGAEFRG